MVKEGCRYNREKIKLEISDDPWKNLLYAVICQAAEDLDVPRERDSAINYLKTFPLGQYILEKKGVDYDR